MSGRIAFTFYIRNISYLNENVKRNQFLDMYHKFSEDMLKKETAIAEYLFKM